jgi:hypothetical protein
MLAARPAQIPRDPCSSYCAGFNLSRRVTLAPKPTWKSVSSTHIRCRMPASLRATATIAHSMLDRLAIRRPHARNADHFLTRSSRLARQAVQARHANASCSRPGTILHTNADSGLFISPSAAARPACARSERQPTLRLRQWQRRLRARRPGPAAGCSA